VGGLSLGFSERARTGSTQSASESRARLCWRCRRIGRRRGGAVLMAYAEPLSEPGSQRPAFVSRSIADSFAADFENADAGEKPTLVSRRVYQDGIGGRSWFHKSTRLKRIDGGSVSGRFPVTGRAVPPGRWRVEFIYSPWWHGPAMAISFAGWFGVFLVGFRFLAGFRRSRNLTRRRWPFEFEVGEVEPITHLSQRREFLRRDVFFNCRRGREHALQCEQTVAASSIV